MMPSTNRMPPPRRAGPQLFASPLPRPPTLIGAAGTAARHRRVRRQSRRRRAALPARSGRTAAGREARHPLEAEILDGGRVDVLQRAESLAAQVTGVAGPLVRQRLLDDVHRIEAAALALGGAGRSAASGPSSRDARVRRHGDPGCRSAPGPARIPPAAMRQRRHAFSLVVAPLLDRRQIRGDVVHLLVLGIVELQHHLLVRGPSDP